MAKQEGKRSKRAIESYEHRDKERLNNPPVGLVTPGTDPDTGQRKKTYAYDPHLDPQLVWAGKAEHTSFEVPTVSLHVHERIEPRTIIEAVRKPPTFSPQAGGGREAGFQLPLFEIERKEPLRQAIEFYQHKHGWTNRLIAGDSLLVMNSLLEKEGMAGKVQMIYIDPPYGIKYGSNFQPFVNKRDVKDGKDEDLTAEPEQIRAFRDTWELGIHSYLTYLRDRLLLARELLTESGSVFVQISDENVHHVRELMDEVFGAGNFVRLITFAKTGSMVSNELGRTSDYLLWYARDKEYLKYRQLYFEKMPDAFYSNVELPDGTVRKITRAEMVDPSLLPSGARVFRLVSLESSGPPGEDTPLEFEGEIFRPNKNRHWSLTYPDGMEELKRTGRMVKDGSKLRWKYYIGDYPLKVLSEVWSDTAGFNPDQRYVVETRTKVVERCLLMTTDPGDLVFDPTCVRKGTRVWVCSPSPTLPAHGEEALFPPRMREDETANTSPRVQGDERGATSPCVRRDETGATSPRVRGDERGATLTPIETIQPGAYVLAHDGLPHRVERCIRRTYKGIMVGIRHDLSDQMLWLTADHKVLAHRRPHSLGGKSDWSGIPKSLCGRSKELRRNLTPPERKLWNTLRGNGTGFAFRRQHPIGPYIADFYCRETALVVEVDGAIAHGEPAAIEHDRIRDEFMRALNLRVLRFPAADVEHNLEGVYAGIEQACQEQLSPEHAEWVGAEQIAKGDILFYGPNLTPARVTEVVTAASEEEVYDLEIEGAHSFITEVCAVHNCGSGTTAYVAEQWGRRWITCDTSRVALTIARQRLMTAVFDYYELAHPEEGVGSGFKYKTVPHVTLKSIANNPEIDGIYARMHPEIEKALADLNAALKGKSIRFKVITGGRANHFVDFAAPDEQTFTMPSGQLVPANQLVEWEVPSEFPPDWPETARAPFERFHQARRTMQKTIDAAIARHTDQETLYDQPFVDRKKVRVTGPFTVEAVPAPTVKSPDEILEQKPQPADSSIARSGETLRQAEWRDELLKTGIRGKAGQRIRFSRLEPLPGCHWLHADGETRPSDEGADSVRERGPAYEPMRAVVSFGPEDAPLEQRQVANAIEEAQTLVPKPKIIVFAAFQFDPEASKDIDETNWPGVTLLKVQMNHDLLTDDLKKKRTSNESFWLMGQPDVEVRRTEEGLFVVEVHGFDYYNTKTGGVESGGKDKIALWMLDTDYDGRSLYPRQVFFPMAGDNEGWAKLARSLKAEIDEDLIESYRGTVSLPFDAGEHRRIAVKIVDDRGIDSLKVMELA